MKIYNSHYFWRTYLGYALPALTGIVLVCAALLLANRGEEQAATSVQLRAHAGLFAVAAAEPLEKNDEATLDMMASSLAATTGLRVTLIRKDGLVLADTEQSPERMDNHLSRPEVQMAIARGRGEVQRFSQTLKENLLYVAVPVRNAQGLLAIVRVARPVTAIAAADTARDTRVLHIGLVGMLLMLLLALYLAWGKTEALENITRTTQAIALGDFDRRLSDSRALGMKRLTDAINQMARHSAQRVSTLTADRNRLATIFTGMVEGVIDVDEKQNIIHINEAAANLLGLDRDRSMGKPVWQETRNQIIIKSLDEAISSRAVIKSQIVYPRASDQQVIDIYVASLSDDQGEPIGAVLVLHDVTELTNLERIRTDFVANASHELKTPITAIRGLSETVVGDADVDRNTLMQFMERILAQSIRLSQLVGDLMTISRLESDQNTVNFTLINFSELVNRALIAAKSALDNRQHQLVTDIADRKLEVFGDRQHLSQLVDNLIDNAIKYTPDKGRIEVRLHPENAGIVFEVEDTGIGISPQFQLRVFERFYRVDKARSQSLGGTGLGLSIVKNIAERHGGNVSVNSQLGRGSIFTFRMPLAQSADKA